MEANEIRVWKMKMDTLMTYEKEPGEPGWQESKVTFRQSLESMKSRGENFPCHFATTEY